jgi:hypothetical protein
MTEEVGSGLLHTRQKNVVKLEDARVDIVIERALAGLIIDRRCTTRSHN